MSTIREIVDGVMPWPGMTQLDDLILALAKREQGQAQAVRYMLANLPAEHADLMLADIEEQAQAEIDRLAGGEVSTPPATGKQPAFTVCTCGHERDAHGSLTGACYVKDCRCLYPSHVAQPDSETSEGGEG